jgi:hypothetical protein
MKGYEKGSNSTLPYTYCGSPIRRDRGMLPGTDSGSGLGSGRLVRTGNSKLQDVLVPMAMVRRDR